MNNPIFLSYTSIKDILGYHHIIGRKDRIYFNNIKSINDANKDSLVFISNELVDEIKVKLILNTNANTILINNIDNVSKDLINNKVFILVDNPKLIFSKIGNLFFIPKIDYTIHPSAIINKETILSKNIYIGPNCVIGKGTIEEGTIIFGNVFIYDNFQIGKNVKINAGTVIGAEGFGYSKDKNNIPIQFPHIGGVIIEDYVEIGSNTSIDRGALANTIIKKGAKIDNQVHIAHNAVIGENSYIIANSMIAGSTIIGDNSYIAPSVSIKDQLTIGRNSTIGMSANVLTNVPDNEIWTGSPAQPLEKIKLLYNKLKKL